MCLFIHDYVIIASFLKKKLDAVMQVIACLDVRANDKGDLVVTKGDQYDVREQSNEKEVREIS